MAYFHFHLAILAFFVLSFPSLTAGTPIIESADAMAKAMLAPPACTDKGGCVNYAHRRCGDPFATGSCVNG